MNIMEGRKKDHLDIVLKEDVQSSHNHWDDFQFVHNAIPEINIDDIDFSTRLFNKNLKAPIIMAGITGGFSRAKKLMNSLPRLQKHIKSVWG